MPKPFIAPGRARPKPVGLIAGGGRLPFLVAEGIRKAGRPLVVVAFRGLASQRLKGLADTFAWASITRPGHWLRIFHDGGVREAVIIGWVRKREI